MGRGRRNIMQLCIEKKFKMASVYIPSQPLYSRNGENLLGYFRWTKSNKQNVFQETCTSDFLSIYDIFERSYTEQSILLYESRLIGAIETTLLKLIGMCKSKFSQYYTKI